MSFIDKISVIWIWKAFDSYCLTMGGGAGGVICIFYVKSIVFDFLWLISLIFSNRWYFIYSPYISLKSGVQAFLVMYNNEYLDIYRKSNFMSIVEKYAEHVYIPTITHD